MLTDTQILAQVRENLEAGDRLVVRNIDGAIPLQRIVRNLPTHWKLRHLVAARDNMLTVVFSRDPAATQPGDFDYFPPVE